MLAFCEDFHHQVGDKKTHDKYTVISEKRNALSKWTWQKNVSVGGSKYHDVDVEFHTDSPQ